MHWKEVDEEIDDDEFMSEKIGKMMRFCCVLKLI